jgi:methylglutaconyl-CoA hydratase
VSAEGLAVERAGETLEVVVSRGDGNRFTTEMTKALSDAVTAAGEDPGVRFVRIRAHGGAFCLGREQEGESAAELRTVSTRIVRLLEVLRDTPAIVVCEVGGDAAGFGVGLAAASDVAVASRDASFWFPELAAGLAPTVVISWLAHLLPRKQAFELVASGRKMGAAEALERGLVTEVTAREEVSAAVDRWLDRLAALDAAALRDVKEFLTRAGSIDETAAGRAAADLLALGSLSRRSG